MALIHSPFFTCMLNLTTSLPSAEKYFLVIRLDEFIKKIDDTRSTDRTNGSGRPKLFNQKIVDQRAPT